MRRVQFNGFGSLTGVRRWVWNSYIFDSAIYPVLAAGYVMNAVHHCPTVEQCNDPSINNDKICNTCSKQGMLIAEGIVRAVLCLCNARS